MSAGQVEKKKVLRIGTRGSALAVAQTDLVIQALAEKYTEYRFEKVLLKTKGDRQLDKALLEFGGKAVFVEEFEELLQNGKIDLAVHSAKDMPVELMDGLEIAGVLERGCPQDVLVCTKNGIEKKAKYEKAKALLADRKVCLEEEKRAFSADAGETEAFVIGTGSLRRKAQILQKYPYAVCKGLRGNVNTRLEKLRQGQYDAILLAAAGLERLGLQREKDLYYEYLTVDEMVPAACQAIIAVEAKKGSTAAKMMHSVSDADTWICFRAERKALEYLEADCHEPVGIFSKKIGDMIRMELYSGQNGVHIHQQAEGKIVDRDAVIRKLCGKE